MTHPLLLDATVWLAAYDDQDRFCTTAREIIRSGVSGDVTLAALDLTLYEISNVAAARWRSVDVSGRLVRLVHATCEKSIVRADIELLADAARIAVRTRLSVYDAAYVAASRRHGLRLVSGDIADLVAPGFAVSPDAVATP